MALFHLCSRLYLVSFLLTTSDYFLKTTAFGLSHNFPGIFGSSTWFYIYWKYRQKCGNSYSMDLEINVLL
ncbi:hypothetical protein QL285_000033 [Trifolium repens]|nr:hypothetical protein QL285_000033 [Trifolium repens]